MVKGVSRRIVVVRAPEQRLFEEAIFILRDDAMQKGVTEDDITAAIFDSIKVSEEAYLGKVKLLDMKGE